MSIFFIVSGMNLDLHALKTVGMIGVGYFIVRIIGKYAGTYAGCLLTKTSPDIRNYMGLALIPQAGVAIGLAFLGQRLLPQETGNLMLAIILSSSVLYEMIGPVCAKLALVFSGSIPSDQLLKEASGLEEKPEEEAEKADEKDSRKEQGSFAEIVEEMNAGVDERDDDDIEKVVSVPEQKEKRKKKKKHRKIELQGV